MKYILLWTCTDS